MVQSPLYLPGQISPLVSSPNHHRLPLSFLDDQFALFEIGLPEEVGVRFMLPADDPIFHQAVIIPFHEQIEIARLSPAAPARHPCDQRDSIISNDSHVYLSSDF